jgi:hypothetical protein
MSDIKSITIQKMGADSPPPPAKPATGVKKKVAKAPARKSMKTFPRGILKKGGAKKTHKASIEPVRDPAKSPPVRKSTLRILTEKGAEKRRQNIRKTVRSMPTHKVRETLAKSGIKLHKNAPEDLARQILEGGVEGGLISSVYTK